jgi:glycosyltransferase involved in cell wall biosynthesis
LLEDAPQRLTIVPDLVRPVHPRKDWSACRRLTQIFSSARPDIVHTHSGKAGILGRLAARKAGVPIIIHSIHGPSFGGFQGALPNFACRLAEWYTARITTHFVTVAHAMTRQYLAAGIGTPGQYTRILSGFPLEPFLTADNSPSERARWGISQDDFVIGKIARFFKLKGHDDLFTVAPALVKANPHLKFLLVGDGVWRGRFERQTRELGLERHFVFTGLVPPVEVPGLIGIMDALVHLSRREGLARALPQALAAAKPVIAYDCDGTSEVCLENETGFLVPAGDLAGLNERILLLSRNPALCQRLGKRGQEMVHELFPLEKMIDQQCDLYFKLTGR